MNNFYNANQKNNDHFSEKSSEPPTDDDFDLEDDDDDDAPEEYFYKPTQAPIINTTSSSAPAKKERIYATASRPDEPYHSSKIKKSKKNHLGFQEIQASLQEQIAFLREGQILKFNQVVDLKLLENGIRMSLPNSKDGGQGSLHLMRMLLEMIARLMIG